MFSHEDKQVMKDLKVIVFRLHNEEYAIEVSQVKSIERLEQITMVPRTPKFVKGVINLRGVVIPIIDLRERLGLEQSEADEHTRIIIVYMGDREVGLIVDSANDVIDIPEKAIEPPPLVVGVVEAAYLRGIAKVDDRLLILLNLNRVLAVDEMEQLAKVEGLNA